MTFAYAKPRKYRNVRRAATTTDAGSEYDSPRVGRRIYDSKAEASYAAKLDLLVQSGQIRAWIPQVSIPVPHTTKRMIIDFMVIMPDGRIKLEDVKGPAPTRDWLLKRELIERALGVPIDIVTRTRGR